MMLVRSVVFCLLLAGCSNDIYLRDGVTNGDAFYLAAHALTDDDPVLQSWVSYSLTLSACKLAIGDENAARSSSFECESTARRHLLETWSEKRGAARDEYLDTLQDVAAAGWLAEYVAAHFSRKHWVLPATLDLAGYRDFASMELRGHKPVTRLIGSWNYARNVASAN